MRIIFSKAAARSMAVFLCLAMVTGLLQVPLNVQAGQSAVGTEDISMDGTEGISTGNKKEFSSDMNEIKSTADTAAAASVDVALQATASANAEHSEWGILAANLNNGHEPAASSNPAGSWHDYGIESADGTSWVQYDWATDVTINSMSIYWMCDGVWEDRIPKSAIVEYKDESGIWQTAGAYDSAIMAGQKADQYNTFAFDREITTKCIRMTMVRNTDDFCSIHRLKIWGKASEDPVSGDTAVTKITDGYRLANNYFIIETGKYGQITSLKLKDDEYGTNFVMNAKNASAQNTAGHQWLGELMFAVKTGSGTVYKEENTSKSDNGRTIQVIDNKVVVTYENATGDKAVKDLKVVETYSLDGNKLKWAITVTNTNKEKLIIGDFGLPLAFNEYWSGGDEIYETRTVDHSYVSKQSSYIYVSRPSGLGKFLLMTPDTTTGAGFEYQDHWRVQERSADEAAWCQDQSGWANGLNVFYIHSDNIKKTNRGYLENTALELAPGESQTYAFNFSAVNNEKEMKSVLYKEGIIDAVAVPGMAYSINMPGKFYLHTPINKEDITFDIACPHETGLHEGNANTVSNQLPCKKTEENTYVEYEKTVNVDGEQYHVYTVHFGDLGQNNVIIHYNGGKSQSVLQFYMMDDVASALETHSEFMVENTQWDTPLKTGNKVFDDWMMDNKDKRGEEDEEYWLKNYWGWGDDWGLTHGEYLAEKNVYQPSAEEIKAVDEYLDIAVWNGLMREHQKDYLIHDFLMEAPNSSPTYRGYAYPHIYNTYFAMYKIASKYPDMVDYTEDADTYLLRAYHILLALYGSTVSYNYGTGLMGELTTPDILAALEKEGYYKEVQAINTIMAKKYQSFKDTKYPYGSEYSYDNTGEEAVYTLAKLNNATDTANSNLMMSKINLKTRACRGLQPVWYQYADPVTNCGENWWQFQYTASLAGYCMDDWLRLQDNGMTGEEKAAASRINYAAKLANLTCINSGQIDADAKNIGAVAWTYQAEMGNLGGQGTGGGSLHNGWRQMSGEADLGLYGALQILSSDVTVDPVFGLFGYGCNVTEKNGIYTVEPLDGLFTRLNFINQGLYLELDRDQYTQAKADQNSTSIQLSMKNLEETAHKTDIAITGLKAGSYQVFVNDTLAGSFKAAEGQTKTVALPLPAASTAKVLITAGTSLENQAPEVSLAEHVTAVISDTVKLEALATDDGYVNSSLTCSWKLITAPSGGKAVIESPSKPITGVTFDKTGEYVFQFTAFDGALSTSREMSVLVEEEPELPQLLADYTFNEGTISGINKLLVNSGTAMDYAELDNHAVIADGREDKGVLYNGSITGGYVELPEAITKHLKQATLSVDVKLSESQSNHTTLFEFGKDLVVEFINGSQLSMAINGKTASTDIKLAEGYWKNIELTADSDDYTLYLDGVKKAALKDTGLVLADIDTEVQRYLIGRSGSESDPFLKGIIDNFVVRAFIMTEEQLLDAYGSGEHELISGKAGSIVTKVGDAPILPQTVYGLYSDGVYEKVSVAWDSTTPADYAQAGTYTVKGLLENSDITVTIKVIVVEGTLQNIAGDAAPTAIINTTSDLGGVKGLNDGFDPAASNDTSHGVWHNWHGNQGAAAWVQYSWNTEQIISGMDVYFFKDGSGNFAPADYVLEYLNENGEWCAVSNANGLGVELNRYNYSSFDTIITKSLRMTMTPAALGCGVIEWKVYGYKEGAVLNKAALNTAIITAEALDEELFTAGMDVVTNALATAKDVAENSYAAQDEIDAAAYDLNTAICSLTPIVPGNIAFMAQVTTSFTSSWENSSAVNDGAFSSVSNSSECTHWGTWGNNSASEAVTYSWGVPMTINSTDLYIWNDGGGIKTPAGYLYEYLGSDGSWYPVTNAVGYEILKTRTGDPTEEPNLDGFNTTSFEEITTTSFRITMNKVSEDAEGVGLVEWRVYGSLPQKPVKPVIVTDPVETTSVPNDGFVSVTIISASQSTTINEIPVYESHVTVTPVSCPAIAVTAATGSAIYYTIDRTKPDRDSILYCGEFILSTDKKEGETITVKAVEYSAGGQKSEVAEKIISFLPAETEPTQTPTLTPAPTRSPTPTLTPTNTPTPTPAPKPTAKPASNPAHPAASVTPTPKIEIIPETEGSAATTYSTLIEQNVMTVSLQLNKEQVLKQFEKAVTSEKEIEIPVISQNIRNQIKINTITQLNIFINVPNQLLSDPNINHMNLKLPAELLLIAAEMGTDIHALVQNEEGKELYSWSFSGRDLSNTNKKITDINLSLKVVKATDYADLGKLLSVTAESENGFVLHFRQEGPLPVQASVKIFTGNLSKTINSKIYLYHFNQNTHKLEALPYSSDYKIDAESYITIHVVQGSDYVMLLKAAKQEIVTSLSEQITVAPTNKTLYFGGTTGYETTIKVSLPPTLETVSSLTDPTSANAIGAVKITYQSSNNNVIKVDNGGKIKAVGIGTANITTTIQLYNNKSAVFITRITVKIPSIQYTDSTNKMDIGDTFTFKVKVYGFNLNDIEWTSSNKSILNINKNGVAIAKSKGSVYVVAQKGSVKKKTLVSIK